MSALATSFEPALPRLPGPELDELRALARALATKAEALAPELTHELAERRRMQNARASNAIEHHFLPLTEIESALRGEPPECPGTEALREEALAHSEVERLVDRRIEEARATGGAFDPMDPAFILWIHGAFYRRTAEKFRRVEDGSSAPLEIVPGEIRDRLVAVGNHWCPLPGDLPGLLKHFHARFRLKQFAAVEDKLIAVAASHARLEWIHPFLDGNGRTGRLALHAALSWVLPCGAWWPVSAGLERARKWYMSWLSRSSQARQGDTDGRGPLSERALREWCKFVLENTIEEIGRRGGESEEMIWAAAIERIEQEFDVPNMDIDILARAAYRHAGRLPRRVREQYPDAHPGVLDRIEEIVREEFGFDS